MPRSAEAGLVQRNRKAARKPKWGDPSPTASSNSAENSGLAKILVVKNMLGFILSSYRNACAQLSVPLVGSFLALNLIYVTWSFLQERLVARPYRDATTGKVHYFKGILVLILMSRIAAMFIGLCHQWAKSRMGDNRKPIGADQGGNTRSGEKGGDGGAPISPRSENDLNSPRVIGNSSAHDQSGEIHESIPLTSKKREDSTTANAASSNVANGTAGKSDGPQQLSPATTTFAPPQKVLQEERRAPDDHAHLLVEGNENTSALARLRKFVAEDFTFGGAPFYLVASCALGNVVSSYCQATSLMYISFVSQCLFKSGKVTFVMLVGMLIHGKRYTKKEYICSVLFGCGAVVFKIGEILKRLGGGGTTKKGSSVDQDSAGGGHVLS